MDVPTRRTEAAASAESNASARLSPAAGRPPRSARSRASRGTSLSRSVATRMVGICCARSRSAAADVLGGVVEHHEIGTRGQDRLEVGLDAVAEARHRARLGRVVAPGGAPHHVVAETERKEEFGGRRNQGHDADRRRRKTDGVAGVVHREEPRGGRGRLWPGARRHARPGEERQRRGGQRDVASATKSAHFREGESGRDTADQCRGTPPVPPPRELVVARTERSPGFGPPLAFPVSQWRRERSNLPVTVAGPRRICTGFRKSAFACDRL